MRINMISEVFYLLIAVAYSSASSVARGARSLPYTAYQQISPSLVNFEDYSPALAIATPQGVQYGMLPSYIDNSRQYGWSTGWTPMNPLLTAPVATYDHSPQPSYGHQYVTTTTPKPAELYHKQVHNLVEEDNKYDSNEDEDDSGEDYDDHSYRFGYRVSDHKHGTEFGQTESKKGSVTTGHYHVLLPDGRLQNVDYWSDHTGFHAHITYTGVAHHIH